jgi:hypothetical protein
MACGLSRLEPYDWRGPFFFFEENEGVDSRCVWASIAVATAEDIQQRNTFLRAQRSSTTLGR